MRTLASGIDAKEASAMPGVALIVTGADLVRAGVKPIPNSADFKRADGRPIATPTPPCARHRHRALRR
jgi:carbon-monoxide dehydrogenase large subunit